MMVTELTTLLNRTSGQDLCSPLTICPLSLVSTWSGSDDSTCGTASLFELSLFSFCVAWKLSGRDLNVMSSACPLLARVECSSKEGLIVECGFNFAYGQLVRS